MHNLKTDTNGKKKVSKTVHEYLYVKVKCHPFAHTDGYISKHRLVLEEYLREKEPNNKFLVEIDGVLYLRKEVIVHHINGDKSDNRVENLEACSRSDHISFHKKSGINPDTLRKNKCSIKHTHPIVSLGKKKMALLRYMYETKDSRFNIKKYHRDFSIVRSSIYYMLDILIEHGLVEKKSVGDYKLTGFGKNYLEVSNRGVKSNRGECREKGVNLSTHYIRYKLPISDKSNFYPERLKELGPNGTHKITWNNDFIYYAYFDDATIIVNPKLVLIRIHDIMVKDTEEAQFKTLNKAIAYSTKIRKIGLISSSIELDKPHYERINSLLADFLKKNVDGRYYLELEDGTKFWIDCSGGTINDETDTETARKRIDKFMSKIMNEDINFDDLKEIKEIAGMLVTFEAMKMREDLKPKEDIKLEERPSYLG